MENNKNENEPKTADSEGYSVENPQNQNQPVYNSTTDRREADKLPGVENLNQTEGLKDELKGAETDNSDSAAPKNDASINGEAPKTDLGNGQRDKDEDEDEKIIRT